MITVQDIVMEVVRGETRVVLLLWAPFFWFKSDILLFCGSVLVEGYEDVESEIRNDSLRTGYSTILIFQGG